MQATADITSYRAQLSFQMCKVMQSLAPIISAVGVTGGTFNRCRLKWQLIEGHSVNTLNTVGARSTARSATNIRRENPNLQHSHGYYRAVPGLLRNEPRSVT